MNRENKRRSLDRNYYRTHPCEEGFTCKVCGWKVNPPLYGEHHRNHCPNCCDEVRNNPGY